MFPEGTRSKDGRVKDGKIGVGMLAHKAGVPIVPVYIENTRKAWWNIFLGVRMRVSFGNVIDREWICSRPANKEGYKEITSFLMEKIRELSVT